MFARTTRDIDANVIGVDFEEKVITRIVKNIINIDINDQVIFNLKKVKENKEYNGYRFSLIATFGNIRIPFHVDVSTGDIISKKI
jgi:23S rRNA G2445 N2-methylase RlmL